MFGNLIILISYNGEVTNADFSIRYILADTIEARGICQIVAEGTGEGFMHIVVLLLKNEKESCKEILSIASSLGLSDNIRLMYETEE